MSSGCEEINSEKWRARSYGYEEINSEEINGEEMSYGYEELNSEEMNNDKIIATKQNPA